jgi:hypothetical protein
MERPSFGLVYRSTFGRRSLGLAFVGAVGALGFACALNPSGTAPNGSTSTGASASSAGGSGGAGVGTGGMAQGGGGTGGSPSSSSAGNGGGGMVYSWDAQTGMNSDGTYTLPSWLLFSSPSANKTSQTSASTIRIGFGPNAARARNVTGMQTDWGLSIESERKNVVRYSDSWNDMWIYLTGMNAMMPTPMQVDPSGGMKATLFQSSGDQASAYLTVTGRVVSAWLRGEGSPGDPEPIGGDLSFAHFRHVDAPGAPFVEVNSTTWTRYSFTNAMNENGSIVLETRDRPSGAGRILGPTQTVAYAGQVEPNAAYPSSYIPTTDADVTRAAEKLWSPMPAALVQDGFFRINLRFAPNYASGEQAGDHELLVFKGNNDRLFVRAMDNAIVLRVDGLEITSDPLEWSREQPITVVAVNSTTELSLGVMGATTGDGAKTQGVGKPMQLDPELYILSNSNGTTECADLRFISFSQP